MSTERKILANLAWRVYKARQTMYNFARLYFGTSKENIYWESVYAHNALHNAFNQAKQIYFDNQPKD
jgi:hypothetical protein